MEFVSYLLQNSVIEKLLEFFITVVDTKLLKTVHLEILYKNTGIM
jgi:hypothetical protein